MVLVALDAATGKILWHVNPGGNLSGAPMTYALDGHQFVLTPVGGWLYAWALPDTRDWTLEPISSRDGYNPRAHQ